MTVLPPQLPQERHLSVEECRALEMLAAAGPDGCTGATLTARGFNFDMLADLVRDGFATARCETIRVGRREITIARVWIADAGRKAIVG
jgi:hypothetical protein